jgi:protein subunit release factor A
MVIVNMLALIAFLFFTTPLHRSDVPTASPAASTLSEIETKARQITTNEERISELNRMIATSIDQERQKTAEMSNEITHLETNRFSELYKALERIQIPKTKPG